MSPNNCDDPGTLSTSDWEILVQGLNALLRERSIAYQIAVKVAMDRGLATPSVGDYGLPDILRLSRSI